MCLMCLYDVPCYLFVHLKTATQAAAFKPMSTAGFSCSLHLKRPVVSFRRLIINPFSIPYFSTPQFLSGSSWLLNKAAQHSTAVSSALQLCAPWWYLLLATKRLVGSRYQMPLLPASSNILTSCSVPFLFTSIVSDKCSQRHSVRYIRLQYHNVEMEKV